MTPSQSEGESTRVKGKEAIICGGQAAAARCKSWASWAQDRSEACMGSRKEAPP